MNRPKAVELEKAQMTIFYGGKVHVFNDFPADKAREVMQFAVTGGPQQPGNERRNLPPTNNTNTKTSFASASVPAASSNPTQPNVLGKKNLLLYNLLCSYTFLCMSRTSWK